MNLSRASTWSFHFGTGIPQAPSCGQNSHTTYLSESEEESELEELDEESELDEELELLELESSSEEEDSSSVTFS